MAGHHAELTLSAGDDGDTSCNGKLAGRDLVAKSINDIGSRANKL